MVSRNIDFSSQAKKGQSIIVKRKSVARLGDGIKWRPQSKKNQWAHMNIHGKLIK